MRMLTLFCFPFVFGCDCGASVTPTDGSRPNDTSSLDSTADDDGSWADGASRDAGRFADADELSCTDIAMRYFSIIDEFLEGRQSCEVDSDCGVAGLTVRCKEGLIDIEGCGTAIAVEYEASFIDDVRALQGELCEVRTSSCVVSNACPELVMSACVSGRCTLQ
jgi:hypothetical protein